MTTDDQEIDAPGPSTIPSDWRIRARRLWPIWLGVLLIALLWVAFGRSGPQVEEVEADAEPGNLVTLDSTAIRLAGVEIVTAMPGGSAPLVANGTITYDANHVSVIAPRVEGRLVSVLADLGHRVPAGGVLAILESAEVGQTRAALERAAVQADVARRNYEREKRLFEQQISPQKELLAAEAELRSAEADVNGAIASLRALGAGQGEGASLPLISPISGTVVDRQARPGEVAGPSSALFTVADLDHVWINVDIYEQDLGRVRDGAVATVVANALPEVSFQGRVTYAGGVVDPGSRAFKVRVELDNNELRLRPGMFAQVRIDAPPPAANDQSVLVPEVAVQDIGGKSAVFVPGVRPGEFEVRTVTVGAGGREGMAVVTAGLAAGERVVANGAFQLKAELLKATFGDAE